MILHHGTSERTARKALLEGLLPRSERRSKGNWSHSVESHPGAVYLTNSYSIHFATQATKADERGAVLEIDTGFLNPFKLVPDEDCLEQVGRGQDDIPGTLRLRTLHYRRLLPTYQGHDKHEVSLRALGNCCYLGAIPPAAISRVAFFNPMELIGVSDPSISLPNYKYMGAHYRYLSRWLFDPDQPPELDTFGRPLGEGFDKLDRSKIEVLTVVHELLVTRKENRK